MSLAFQLKGNVFTLSVLKLLTADLQSISEQLDQRINIAPKFFNNLSMIIDLQLVEKEKGINVFGVKTLLEKKGIVPLAFKCYNDDFYNKIKLEGIPVLKENKISKSSFTDDENSINSKNMNEKATIITEPVRSGQVISSNGDLIILSSISSGAELIANGNIHIYSVLRGRAMAGMNGDKKARIFCKSLDASLVSIAGNYRILDDYEGDEKPKQIYLDDGYLVINNL